MSNESIKNSSTFLPPTSDIFDQTEQHIDRETFILSLFLLHERSKGIQSHWYPYIQLLPHTYLQLHYFIKKIILKIHLFFI